MTAVQAPPSTESGPKPRSGWRPPSRQRGTHWSIVVLLVAALALPLGWVGSRFFHPSGASKADVQRVHDDAYAQGKADGAKTAGDAADTHTPYIDPLNGVLIDPTGKVVSLGSPWGAGNYPLTLGARAKIFADSNYPNQLDQKRVLHVFFEVADLVGQGVNQCDMSVTQKINPADQQPWPEIVVGQAPGRDPLFDCTGADAQAAKQGAGS